MKNSLLYYLIVSSALLVGCETNQSVSNIVVERPFGTIFDEQVKVLEKTSLGVIQANKKVTDFSPKENTQESDQVIQPPGKGLDNKDLLYGFYNSGVVGTPPDFDTFFDEVESQNNNTKNVSSAGTSSATTASEFGTLFNSSAGTSADFDTFFSDTGQSSLEVGGSFSVDSDFQLDVEKQEKIKIIKETTITTQKNNVIADQIRNEDIDMQLITDLDNLEKNIPIQEKELVKMMKNKLNHKIRLLDAEAALKVAEIKMYSNAESNVVVARVEDRVLSATSGMRNDLIRKMLSSEPENYYQLKEQGKQLEAVYQVDIARAKLKYQQQIDVLEGDVKSLRVANKRIINNRLSEMEEQRIAEALTVEEKIKAKNQKAVDQSYPTFEEKILEYTNTFKSKLAQRVKSVLDRLNSEYANAKFARESARNLENRQYIADINQQIEQEQTSYKDKSTVSLYASRDAKINSIANNLKRSIKRVKSDGTQALADLKSSNAREHQKQKSVLHAPYNKKRQALNQKYQQAKSKILSRFRSEEYAVVAKIRKETGVANREIDARVKAEIKALLDSFEALKKEEAENKIKEEAAKKAIEIEKLKKSKESPGFFKSFF